MSRKETVDPEWMDWVECQARMLRRELALSEIEVLDPYELVSKMDFIKLMPLDAIKNVPSEVLSQLLVRDAGGWSAGSLIFPNGDVVVIMNPRHRPTRARATLMEEVAHIQLGHQPSLLTIGADGITTRSYNERQEREAYWVGAAALVPIGQLRIAQKIGRTIKEMADYCEVSRPLVKFRADTTHISLAA